MIGKEGRQTDDMNSVSQSAEIVKKKMEKRTKIKTIVNEYGWEDNLHSSGVSGDVSAQVQVQGVMSLLLNQSLFLNVIAF